MGKAQQLKISQMQKDATFSPRDDNPSILVDQKFSIPSTMRGQMTLGMSSENFTQRNSPSYKPESKRIKEATNKTIKQVMQDPDM